MRVTLLLVLIWIFSMIDLAFTILALGARGFEEWNFLARGLNAQQLIIFKFGLLVPATIILAMFRHMRVSEIGCWIGSAWFGGVTAIWLGLYNCLLYAPYGVIVFN